MNNVLVSFALLWCWWLWPARSVDKGMEIEFSFFIETFTRKFAYFDDWTLVRLYKLFLTERKLAKICANGVTIKSSTWLALSLDTACDDVVVSAASFILTKAGKTRKKRMWVKMSLRMVKQMDEPFTRYARIPRHRLWRHFKIRIRSIEKWFAPLRHILKNESSGGWCAFEGRTRALSILNVKAAKEIFWQGKH